MQLLTEQSIVSNRPSSSGSAAVRYYLEMFAECMRGNYSHSSNYRLQARKLVGEQWPESPNQNGSDETSMRSWMDIYADFVLMSGGAYGPVFNVLRFPDFDGSQTRLIMVSLVLDYKEETISEFSGSFTYYVMEKLP